MKRNLMVIILSSLLAGCVSPASMMTSRSQSWILIQSAGGLRVDDPVTQADGTIFLPVICNLSGLETITVQPTLVNSALAVKEITAGLRDDKIQIQVVTCAADNKHTSVSTGVNLGTPKKGTYRVEYLNPDGITVSIREIAIK